MKASAGTDEREKADLANSKKRENSGQETVAQTIQEEAST